MPVTFRGLGQGSQLAPGTRVRTVWLLDTLGEVSAALNPFRDATDELGRSAQAVIEGVSSAGVGFVINYPPAIAPGDLGVVLDIKLVSSGQGVTAGTLADTLQDMVSKLELDSLGLIPAGETASDALAEREKQTKDANKEASESLPSGILAGAADSVGQGAKNLVTFIKWTGVILIIAGVWWVYRTYIK